LHVKAIQTHSPCCSNFVVSTLGQLNSYYYFKLDSCWCSQFGPFPCCSKQDCISSQFSTRLGYVCAHCIWRNIGADMKPEDASLEYKWYHSILWSSWRHPRPKWMTKQCTFNILSSISYLETGDDNNLTELHGYKYSINMRFRIVISALSNIPRIQGIASPIFAINIIVHTYGEIWFRCPQWIQCTDNYHEGTVLLPVLHNHNRSCDCHLNSFTYNYGKLSESLGVWVQVYCNLWK
jgi:hypothetical protein